MNETVLFLLRFAGLNVTFVVSAVAPHLFKDRLFLNFSLFLQIQDLIHDGTRIFVSADLSHCLLRCLLVEVLEALDPSSQDIER